MPPIRYKRLPRGFIYPVSKRDVREIIEPYKEQFILIEFEGISSSEGLHFKRYSSERFSIGGIEAERVDNRWEFCLTLSGLRKETVGDDRQKIVEVFRNDLIYWVEKHKDLPETTPDTAPDVYLKVQREETNGEITSGSFVSAGNKLPSLRKFKDY